MTTVIISDNTGADFPGSSSTWVDSGAPTTNQGASATIEVNLYGGPSARANGLLRFPGVSNIPPGATILAVTLGLHLNLNSLTDDAYQVGVYRSNRAWVQAQATELEYSTGNAWTNPGGYGSPDSAVVASAAEIIDSTVPAGYIFWENGGLIADVQAWVNGTANNGWVIIKDGGGSGDSSFRQFAGTTGADTARPLLVVEYGSSSAKPWLHYAQQMGAP